MDNGPESLSKELDRWAYERNATLDFSQTKRPTNNPFMGSFNGSFCGECLNTNYFLSVCDARAEIESWRRDYNLVNGDTNSALQEKHRKEANLKY